ncbi:hypothetical protein CLPU_5c02230 [Gottschalkia purinilytica]|uniref:Uncharacterized protein n=1 Tax=Gottschalkia purinilytica TaxID=1503 RepID=A0A0L0WBQ7_GOTPU|nr:hypothetical protein [Gottschalkia purinilytica]KNF08916.1 hypothetical protein CLPU_5c02230 [Gottschalkia purinilytica]
MSIVTNGIYMLICMLIGYGLGRRIGIKEGEKKGLLIAPLELRKDMLTTGKCPICDRYN